MAIDRTAFFARARQAPFEGVLHQIQVSGMTAILDAWDKWRPGSDPRWIAYSLGTSFWETARTIQPISEYDPSPSYGDFFGRGYVQLTWKANYEKATTRLRAMNIIGANVDLVASPDLALQPNIAAPVMIFGMVEGWFTGKKLADYFSAETNWVNAREIVNALDHATTVAGAAEDFYEALTAVSWHECDPYLRSASARHAMRRR